MRGCSSISRRPAAAQLAPARRRCPRTGRRRGAARVRCLLEVPSHGRVRRPSGDSSSTWPSPTSSSTASTPCCSTVSRCWTRMAEAVAVQARGRRRCPRRPRRCGRSGPAWAGSLLSTARPAASGSAGRGHAGAAPPTAPRSPLGAPRPSRGRSPRAPAPRASSSDAASASSCSRWPLISSLRPALALVGELAAAPRRAFGSVMSDSDRRRPAIARDDERAAHAVLVHHRLGDLGHALEVVGRARGDRPEHELLGDAARQQHGHVLDAAPPAS